MGTRTGTYYTGTINGTAGSLITALDAILVTGQGWTKLFSGTNKAVYQAASGNQFCIRVVDDGSLAAGAREALVRGGESATDVDTLVDAFPSTALQADATMIWRKSDTADATSRNYYAVADGSFLALCVKFGTNSYDLYCFGDIEPVWSGDNYATILTYRSTANNAGAGLAVTNIATALNSAITSQMWFARTADGLTKIERGALMSTVGTAFGNTNAGDAVYPHPYTTKLHWSAVRVRGNGTTTTVIGTGGMVRGVLPFVFEPLFGTTVSGIAVEDTFTDTAYGATSEFVIFAAANNFASNGARWILQKAGTWNGGV